MDEIPPNTEAVEPVADLWLRGSWRGQAEPHGRLHFGRHLLQGRSN